LAAREEKQVRTVAAALVGAAITLATVPISLPAGAWRAYAQWGMNEVQLVAASQGQAKPCRRGVVACSRLFNKVEPKLYVDGIAVGGFTCSASFGFDSQGLLSQTILLFENAEFSRLSDALSDRYGAAREDRPGVFPVRVWWDLKKGTVITMTGAEGVVRVSYEPAS
jgi:hypothetical protein